jgi:hypothetical protein
VRELPNNGSPSSTSGRTSLGVAACQAKGARVRPAQPLAAGVPRSPFACPSATATAGAATALRYAADHVMMGQRLMANART